MAGECTASLRATAPAQTSLDASGGGAASAAGAPVVALPRTKGPNRGCGAPSAVPAIGRGRTAVPTPAAHPAVLGQQPHSAAPADPRPEPRH